VNWRLVVLSLLGLSALCKLELRGICAVLVLLILEGGRQIKIDREEKYIYVVLNSLGC
jgi:hypothetical protein